MQGRRIGDALKTQMNGNNLGVECARSLYDGMTVLTLMYGCEALVLLRSS